MGLAGIDNLKEFELFNNHNLSSQYKVSTFSSVGYGFGKQGEDVFADIAIESKKKADLRAV
jgi:hypothetical protein